MKKRILSVAGSMAVLVMLTSVSAINVQASDSEMKMVDGSYLTTDDSSTGHSSSITRGKYLMTGECSISNAGLTRIYAYGSTTANQEVNYLATIVYVDQYHEEEDEWWQIYAWSEEAFNDDYMSTAKSVKVDRGYYYRVRANHIAGDEYPYEETVSFTDGIFVP
ncbi:MAG TPA: hypothetical protein H9743_09860 [Candidatus Mediterraneibacter vanvlietii]|nr:hypothetical protein [Candidatus Mediterraneibacter vanvlietii]